MPHKHDRILSLLRPDQEYTLQNRAVCLLPGNRLPENTAGSSLLGTLQSRLKRYGPLYYFLLRVFAPVCLSGKFKKLLRQELLTLNNHNVALNLGSGPQVLAHRQDVINVDLFAFDNVDLVADARDVPLQSNCADLILSLALLEHVKDPQAVVREMHRLLKPGGRVLCYLPFMVPFHAAPHDYQRWTLPGARSLFQGFAQVQAGVGAGPTSALLYVFQEWVASCFSLGSRQLHDILFLLLLPLTAPIKLLDLALTNNSNAEMVASGFYVWAQKADIHEEHHAGAQKS